MIDHLALHEATAAQIRGFLATPSHALLIAGPDGIGKTAIAEAVVSAMLKHPLGKLESYPHFLRVQPVNGTISIEAIRDLQRFLQLKTIGSNPYRRAVVIEHAHGLTTEAQNAFLKLLEEPPADTVMILTVHSPRALLATILSRVQLLTAHVPTQPALQPLLDATSKDAATTNQAYFLSGGLPGLLNALLAGDEAHPLLASVASAKEVLQKQPFERLAMVDALSKQKDAARGVLEALDRIAQAGMQGASSKQDPGRIKQWHHVRKSTFEASQALDKSANAKLVLTNLFLNLP